MSDLPYWHDWALGEVGTREIPGPRHAPRVLDYWSLAGAPHIRDDETAWCGAFAAAALVAAGAKPPEDWWRARAWTAVGTRCPIARGAVAVFSSSRGPASGHVGFVVNHSADQIQLLGGNQNNSVSIAWFPKKRLLAVRWPFHRHWPSPGEIMPLVAASGEGASDA